MAGAAAPRRSELELGYELAPGKPEEGGTGKADAPCCFKPSDELEG